MKEQTENNEIKAGLGERLEYYYGFGMGRYSDVLEELRVHGRVNSFRTSSIPLAEFWQPANLGRITEILRPKLAQFDAKRAMKYFEFPTDAIREGRRIGRPSMTDLMLLDGDLQIAVEAKFTEYSRAASQTVGEWLMEKKDSHFFLRRSVARTWLRYILDAKCSKLNGELNIYKTPCRDVGYQFLHRTASACYKTNGADGRMAALVYQLFYDAADAKSAADCAAFQNQLAGWADALKLCNMRFLALSVPVLNAAEVAANCAGMKEEIFSRMANHTIYKFDFDAITIKEVR